MALSSAEIVITTYHVLITEQRRKQSPLHEIMWYRVVLDEGKFGLYSCVKVD
jgi:SNF2 family DNA or RNA helicase